MSAHGPRRDRPDHRLHVEGDRGCGHARLRVRGREGRGLGWRAISGRPAPREEDQLLNYKLAEIVTFAIISGATVTLVRELGLRQAAKWYSARRPDSPYAMRAISA